MSMRAGIKRWGFSLIEVLVALVLLLTISVVASQAVLQVVNVVNRMRARQAMHETALTVAQRLRQDFAALMQHGAFYAVASGGVGAAQIELVYLRGRNDHTDFSLISGDGNNISDGSDVTWSRLCWSQASAQLTLAENQRSRRFTLTGPWGSGGKNYQKSFFWFVDMPQPRRKAAVPLATALNDNAWGTGSPGDIGDYDELVRNAVPIASGCTDLAVELVFPDASTQRLQAGTATSIAIDGMRVDGEATAMRTRPALIRLRFQLADAASNLVQPFSFTFAASAVLPHAP